MSHLTVSVTPASVCSASIDSNLDVKSPLLHTKNGPEYLIAKSHHNLESNYYNNQHTLHTKPLVSANISPEIGENKCKSSVSRMVLQLRELGINSDTIRLPNITMQSHEYTVLQY